jgi:hypothetical protein
MTYNFHKKITRVFPKSEKEAGKKIFKNSNLLKLSFLLENFGEE